MKIINLTSETIRIIHPDCIEAGSRFDRSGYSLKKGQTSETLINFLPDPCMATTLDSVYTVQESKIVHIPLLKIARVPEPAIDTIYIVDDETFRDSTRRDFYTPGSVVYNALGDSIGYANLRTR